MKTKNLPLVAVLGLALLAVGCSGKNAPCDTDPAMIESAREDVMKAEQELAAMKSQMDAVEAEKSELAGEMENLPTLEELEARLHTLKKGSGR